jgi:hypothetical protein
MNVPEFRLAILIGISSIIMLFPGAHVQAAGVRSYDWTQTATAEFETGQMTGIAITNLAGGELRLSSSAATGIYTSTVFTSPFSFNAIVPHWRAVVPDGATLRVEVRVYTASSGWLPWHPFDDSDWIAARGQFYPETPLLLSDGRQCQYRVTLTAATAGQTPILDEMIVTIIDTTAGPTTLQAKAAVRPSQVTTQDVSRPAIISRNDWGANEDWRRDENGSLLWPLEYRSVEKIIVHHTVSANDYAEEQAASLVRGIYYYHAVTRGWGDIGYNYLVDKYGNIYEGRYGGPGVVGGHVHGYNYGSMGIGAIGSHGNTQPPSEPPSDPPTGETLTAIADLVAWEANRSYIHPLESAPFYGVTMPNLTGHRDYSATNCPGDYFNVELPSLRQAAWQRIVSYTAQYCVDWLGWNTPPPTLLAGETYSLATSVRNTGWFTWPSAGLTTTVSLGHYWLDSDTQPVAPPDGDYGDPLAYDLSFGHIYNFEPTLITTPITPGTFTLAWDMMYQDVAWFHDANPDSPRLTFTLAITSTPPVTISGRLLDVRGHPVGGGLIALPNWVTVTSADDGTYALPRLARTAYTLTTSVEDHVALPPAYGVDATSNDVTYPFVLMPDSFVNLVVNGNFENGLNSWSRGGVTTSLPVSTTAAHTGLGAAQLGGSVFTGAVWLSQALDLPACTLSPTLSLLYRVPVAGDGTAFQVVLAGDTSSLIYTLPLAASNWTHFWTDLPGGRDALFDLQLKLTQSGSSTFTTVLMDEVWLGHQGVVSCTTYLPLVLQPNVPD